MSEKIPNIIEKGSEHIPTLEEVREVFDELAEGRKYEELRKKEDEDGLYSWEIVIHEEERDVEYLYRRGRPSQEENPGLRVDLTFFDLDGVPMGGHCVAKHKGGKWNVNPKFSMPIKKHE